MEVKVESSTAIKLKDITEIKKEGDFVESLTIKSEPNTEDGNENRLSNIEVESKDLPENPVWVKTDYNSEIKIQQSDLTTKYKQDYQQYLKKIVTDCHDTHEIKVEAKDLSETPVYDYKSENRLQQSDLPSKCKQEYEQYIRKIVSDCNDTSEVKATDYLIKISDIVKIKKEVPDVDVKTELTDHYEIPMVKDESDFLDQPCSSKQSRQQIRKETAHKIDKKKKRKYFCPVCGKDFRKHVLRKKHFNSHFHKTHVLCRFCGDHFMEKIVYLIHQFDHFLKIRRPTIKRKSESIKIARRKRSIINEQFECTICLKKYKYESSLRSHIRRHFGLNKNTCEICFQEMTNTNALKKHIRDNHGHDQTPCTETPFKCDVCSKYFKSSKNLERHMSNHSDMILFTCHVCSKQFLRESYLKDHLRCHIGENLFKCEICLKQFSKKSSLQAHMCNHTGEKPFKCEICPNSFLYQSDLTIHMRCHTGYKPYKCDICGKEFKRQNNLNCHMRCHTGEKPFKCDMCPKRFTSNSSLLFHLRRHTGEKPFVCEFCLKTFTQNAHLQSHLLCHTGEKPFKCEICLKTFARKFSLKSHMNTHKKEGTAV